MLYFAHIGFTVFIASMLYLPVIFAVAGALLPDIIDKGGNAIGLIPCGRYFGHSIFFPLTLGFLTYIITRKWKLTLAIFVGSFGHLLLDSFYFLPWFFPLIKYPQLSVCAPLKMGFGIFEIVTEIIGAGLLIFTLGFTSKLIYIRKSFWNLLLRIKGKLNVFK
jgi:hypothetical protein